MAKVYRGIRYARAERFSPPVQESLPEDIVSACTALTYASPQPPQRFAEIFGAPDDDFTFSEDCLRVSVYTPDENGKRPVLVWIHGGAYQSGSGEMRMYGSSALCTEGDIVVVNVCYRLGALGFLYEPKNGIANLGQKDIQCALCWVKDNIRRFGGDPERITVMGQSAGGYSTLLLINGCREPLFRKAVVLSAPYPLSLSERTAARIASSFRKFLGKDIFKASWEEILKAQVKTVKSTAVQMPFMPVAKTSVGRENLTPGLKEALICYQKDDGRSFVPAGWLTGIATKFIFRDPAIKYAKVLQSLGVRTTVRELSFMHKDGPFGAVHTMELPLLFGSWEVWKDVPMLKGCSREAFETNARELRAYISSFVKD